MAKPTSNSHKTKVPSASATTSSNNQQGSCQLLIGDAATASDPRGEGRAQSETHVVDVSPESAGKCKVKSIVPSASSIVLELLDRSAKQKLREEKIIMTSSPTPHQKHHVESHNNTSTSATATNASNNNNNNSEMSVAVVAPAAGGGPGDGHTNNTSAPPPASNPQQNPKSVVPQLMDIYDHLAQSSTPQTTVPMPALPQIQMPKGVFYSGPSSQHSDTAASSSSHTTDLSGTRRISVTGSRSQYSAPAPMSSSVRSSRRSAPKRVKSSEIEDHPSRKKGKTLNKDQRWSKRFTWPDELHRDFVSAIFDVGLKHSSPSAIMEFMAPNPDVTSERVKSHLQKYRLNRDKSRKEFMTSYDSALGGFQKRQEQQQQQQGEHEEAEGIGSSLSCGEGAALCTHASLNDSRRNSSCDDNGSVREESRRSTPVQGIAPMSTSSQHSHSSAEAGEGGVGTLHMPLLTTKEKNGPIGQAFGYLVGLHQALSQQLEESRQQQESPDGHAIPSIQPVSSQAVSNHYHEQYPPLQQQVYHQPVQPTTAEQAAANAASIHANDPAIHEVAASIPHAVMLGSQPTIQAPPAPVYTGAQSQQQYHYTQPPLQPQQYAQAQAQAQAPVASHVQHPSHYNGAPAAPALQGEYVHRAPQAHPYQQVHQPQYAYGAPAPAPQPAYTHPPRAATGAPAPSSHTSGHPQQHPPQKYLPPNHHQPHPAHEIPAILHHNQQPSPQGQPQSAFAPRNPPPPRSTHPPAGPPRKAAPVAPAMHHPSAPQAAPVASAPPPQAHANVKHESQYHSQQQHQPQHQNHHYAALPPPPAPSHQSEPAPANEPPITQPKSDSNSDTINTHMVGSGRTLQAQKESSMMKQEMQGQMVFQNKIRALKQIELSKYGGKEESAQYSSHDAADHHNHDNAQDVNHASAPEGASDSGTTHLHDEDNHPEPTDINAAQNHHMSEEHDHELIWNPEDDDQIFDFLMDN